MSARHSTTDAFDDQDLLLKNEAEIADQEARNGLLQFDEVLRLVEQFATKGRFTASPELFLDLNRIAIQGIRKSAGQFRQTPVVISNTTHQPPPADMVPELVREMCAYVNSNWDKRGDDLLDAIHVAAYLMWRLNWIHPFRDGNGRTSRAISYLALCVRLGGQLPGTPTIPEQIVDNKMPYYEALDAADTAWRKGDIEVSLMENLMTRLLEIQIQI